jgi:uncharacterized DUF497 family protein
VTVGMDALARVLTLVYRYPSVDRIRIISARKADAKARSAYEQHS